MKKKETKKVLKLSSETLHQLERPDVHTVGNEPRTMATTLQCCP